MYFAGEQLNDLDHLRNELSPEARDRVTITLQPAPPKLQSGAQFGEFDITIRQVG